MGSINRRGRGPSSAASAWRPRVERAIDTDAPSGQVCDGPRRTAVNKEPLPGTGEGGWNRRHPWSLNLVPSVDNGDPPAMVSEWRRKGWLKKHPKTGEEMGYFTSAKQRKAAMKEMNARNTQGWKRDPGVV